MREICEVLGFNKSTFYYQPKSDPSEDVLRAEILRLAAAYPTYGYRRITKMLVETEGTPVGYKRVARLMKEMNLLVSVKRACRTTRSLQGDKPWSNLLQPLEVSHRDQVWVGDITYVRLNRRFIYVAVLMDVFTRMIRGWNLGQHLNQTLTLNPWSKHYTKASRRSTIPIKACNIFQRRISRCSKHTRLRFNSSQRVSLGQRIRRKTHPHAQGRRSLPQRLPRYYRGSTKHRSFSHTGI